MEADGGVEDLVEAGYEVGKKKASAGLIAGIVIGVSLAIFGIVIYALADAGIIGTDSLAMYHEVLPAFDL